jgi:hypothetical protein
MRRTGAVLLAGWLLGLLTAFVWPAVSVERQTVLVNNAAAFNRIRDMAADGWTVSRSDVALDDIRLITFGRPRYVGIAEMMSSWEPGPPRTPAPAPKPTTKPAAPPPAASPGVP